MNVQESGDVGSISSWLSFIVASTSEPEGYFVLSSCNVMFGISKYVRSTLCVPPARLYSTFTELLKEKSWIKGHAFWFIPICPTGTFAFVFKDGVYLTTLFWFVGGSGVPEHGVRLAAPWVVPDNPAESGIATPSVCEKSAPRIVDGVEPEQKTPKSRLCPGAEIAIWSACFALSTFAKNAYQLPSELWIIRKFLPFTVTIGSPWAWSSWRLSSLTITSTTIGPKKWFTNTLFSAETIRLGWSENAFTFTGDVLGKMSNITMRIANILYNYVIWYNVENNVVEWFVLVLDSDAMNNFIVKF